MKKILLVWLALILLSATNGNAQVRIGDTNDPAQGAVLDLNTSGYKGGLLLPHVALTTMTAVTDLTSPADAANLKGLIVYNTTPATEGVYVWVWDETAQTGQWSPLWGAGPLDAVAIETVGGGNSFGGGVTFKLSKPAGWPAAQWAALSAGNVTATLAGAAYPGALAYNVADDSYYYRIVASAATAQDAVLTVSGSIGENPVATSTKTVTVKTNAAVNTFALDGANAFDIKRSGDTAPDWATRVQADFSKTYDYSLTGVTLATGYAISSITWSSTNPESAVKTITPSALSATPAENKASVLYDGGKLIGNATITAEGIQVIITATIVVTGPAAFPKTTYTASRTVTIKDADACLSVTDLEGNSYLAAQFGAAGCWMTENLKSTYNNILLEGALTEANNAGTDFTKQNYYYPNNATGDDKASMGLLYTWAAAANRTGITDNEANNPIQDTYQGICPSGWHLPSDYEWTQLEEEIALDAAQVYSTTATATTWAATYYTAVGTRGAHGQKMKSVTPVTATATAGTSQLGMFNGFDARLVGYLNNTGALGSYGTYARFWSSSSYAANYAWIRELRNNNTGMYREENTTTTKAYLHSVRCKKDAIVPPVGE